MKWRLTAPLILIVLLQGCATREGPRSVRTGDAYSRIIPASDEEIIRAARGVIRELELPLDPAAAGPRQAMSRPVTLQGRWGSVRVSERLLCGTATAERFDAEETRRFTDEIPVEVRLGFVVEQRLEETLTTLTFQGVGQRRHAGPLFNRDLPCAPTREFIRELFERLEARLAMGRGVATSGSASR